MAGLWWVNGGFMVGLWLVNGWLVVVSFRMASRLVYGGQMMVLGLMMV